ncbi:MAG: DNA-binding protein [Candidatus Bathyarchaeia archaeon]
MSETSDLELELIRQRKLMEMRKHLESKTKDESEKTRGMDQRKILDRFFVDRAWEVLNAAKAQYPEVANYIENLLAKLIMEGKIKEKISGEELYGLFLRLGFRVKLSTRIQIVEHGKIKSLEEKIKEETG